MPIQIEACQALAQQQGYRVPEHYVFTDDLTGTILERPVLQQVRELIRSRAIQAAIVYDHDRLSRKHGHQLLLLEECERAEVAVLAASSPIEATPEGTFLLHMKGAMAEYERAKIMERTRRGRVGRARAGQVWGGVVPFGYRYVSEPHHGHYVIDEAEAVVVRRTFAMTLEGGTVRGIAMRLA